MDGNGEIVFIVCGGERRSATIVSQLRRLGCSCLVCDEVIDLPVRKIVDVFASTAVAIFDATDGVVKRRFEHFPVDKRTKVPDWVCGAKWVVGISPQCVVEPRPGEYISTPARQLFADFVTHYEERIAEGMYPWGEKKTQKSNRFPSRSRYICFAH